MDDQLSRDDEQLTPEVCEAARKTIQDIEGMLTPFYATWANELISRFGDEAIACLTSVEHAVWACGSDNLKSRTAGIEALLILQKTGQSLPESILRILRSDDPQELKTLASSLLPRCARHRLQFPYLQMLLPFTLDEILPLQVRVHYYNVARQTAHVLEFVGKGLSLEFFAKKPTPISSQHEIDIAWVLAILRSTGQD